MWFPCWFCFITCSDLFQPAASDQPESACIVPLIAASTVVRKVGDACQFACPYCQITLKSTSEAYVHIRTWHDGMPNNLPLVMHHAKDIR